MDAGDLVFLTIVIYSKKVESFYPILMLYCGQLFTIITTLSRRGKLYL